jgi:ribose transport system substrate-binding protein
MGIIGDPKSRRQFLSAAALLGVAAAAGSSLAGCATGNGTPGAGPTTPTISDPNDPRNKKFKLLDQFYTLDNDYFQGYSKGGAAAAAAFLMQREEIVDNVNDDTVSAAFESARSTKGTQAINFFTANPAITPEVLRMAQGAGIFVSASWTLQPWTTPFDIGDKFYAFQTPNDFAGARELCKVLFKEMGGSGKFIHIEGIRGNTVSENRTAGVDAALKDFPQIELVARQPGDFSRGGTQPVIENLLTAHPDVKGIMCSNDDSAIAAINALESRGMTVPVVGIDAIPEFLDAIKRGKALATWAHHGAWTGAHSTVRLFDALAGVKIPAAERMMFCGGFIIDGTDAADMYQKKMYGGGTFPFDYEKMSMALHPDDWDPQNLMVPMDIEAYWARTPKPSGYQIPAEYQKSKKSNEFEKVAARYKAAFRSDPFADVRKLCKSGGQDITA